MNAAMKLTLTASGVFLLTGMLTGVWKYRAMMTRPDHRAPFYVDTAHRAALLYSFAALVIARLLEGSPLGELVQLVAAGAVLFFFASAIGTYVLLGVRNRTDNQFRERSFTTTWGMALLIAGEIGGFVVIFWGFLSSQVLA